MKKFLLIALASLTAPAAQAETVAGEAAVTLGFAPAEASLDQNDKAKIQEFAQSIKTDQSIAQIAVVAWSDKPLPEGKGKQLPKSDMDLAAERGKAVEKELVALGVKAPYVYSMAQRPGAAATILHTDNAILKGQDAKPKGAKAMEIAAIGQELVAKGKPGTAVVVALRLPVSAPAK